MTGGMRHDLRRIIQIKTFRAIRFYCAEKTQSAARKSTFSKVRFIELSAPFRTLRTAYLILSSTHSHQMNKTSRDPTSRDRRLSNGQPQTDL
jgi:hypothetical protein